MMAAPAITSRYRVGDREFIVLMAALSALNAIAIDVMLPAFGLIRAAFDLAPTATEVSLLVSFYMFGLGLGQIAWGPISDALGRKPVLFAGLGLYLIAAAGTILAPSLPVMFASRFLWGLGAAGPRVVSIAMVRDRYRGDDMARVMSVVMGVFLMVPAVAPTIGRLALELGSWRYPFVFSALFGLAVGLWSLRLRETLPVEGRRPLRFGTVVDGAKAIVHTRSTAWATVAITFAFGAFLPYLGSSQLIYAEIYDRESQFPFWFGLTAGAMAVASVVNSRVVRKIGSRRTLVMVQTAFAVIAVGYLALALLSGGRPPFALFYVVTSLLVATLVTNTALLNSLAMEEVGHVAGMASALIGAVPTVFGAVLAGFVDQAVSDTITPVAVGFLAFGLLMIAATNRARGAAGDPTDTADTESTPVGAAPAES